MAYYPYQRKTRNLFIPNNSEPFKLSRTKIEQFISCQRCFYLDRRLGISRPDFPSFNLNNAVDTLLKKEFDIYREKGESHPLMIANKISAIPYKHEKLNEWRHNFTGMQYHHIPTNFIIFGAVDDLWITDSEELFIVDYKATSTSEELTLDKEYRESYKRQMEIYQWLFRKNNFKVSDTGYFVYCNGLADKDQFDNKLEFSIKLITYEGNSDWVNDTIMAAHQCLMSDNIPAAAQNCDFCAYRQLAQEMENSTIEAKAQQISMF